MIPYRVDLRPERIFLTLGIANFRTEISTLRKLDFRLDWSDMRPGKGNLRLY